MSSSSARTLPRALADAPRVDAQRVTVHTNPTVHNTAAPPPAKDKMQPLLSRGARPLAKGMRQMSGKEINFGTEGRALMLRGVDQLADAVSVTLGPKGRNAILDQPYGAPKITKDGVTVAKNIEFRDRFENMGAQLVRQVATRTNDAAGDGTTTATVLTRAIFAEGVKAVAAGMNPDLRRGIRAAAHVKEIEASQTDFRARRSRRSRRSPPTPSGRSAT